MKLAFALRGHERHSLENKNLYNYLKELSQYYDFDIYIHTWNLSEAKSSWRPVSKKRKEINYELISEYFSGLNLKKIIIDDDEDIKLHGRTTGKLGRLKSVSLSNDVLKNVLLSEIGDWAKNYKFKELSISSNYEIFLELGCPIIGWKKMWYGIYSIIKEIYESNKYDVVINSRLDILEYKKLPNYMNNPECPSVDIMSTLNLINNYSKQNSILFLREQNCICIDNFYIGPVEKIYNLCEKFHYNLDDILEEHKIKEWESNQEKLVFLQAKKLCNISHL